MELTMLVVLHDGRVVWKSDPGQTEEKNTRLSESAVQLVMSRLKKQPEFRDAYDMFWEEIEEWLGEPGTGCFGETSLEKDCWHLAFPLTVYSLSIAVNEKEVWASDGYSTREKLLQDVQGETLAWNIRQVLGVHLPGAAGYGLRIALTTEMNWLLAKSNAAFISLGLENKWVTSISGRTGILPVWLPVPSDKV